MKAKIKTNVLLFILGTLGLDGSSPWQIHVQTMPPETSQQGSTHPEQHHSIKTYSVYNTGKGENTVW